MASWKYSILIFLLPFFTDLFFGLDLTELKIKWTLKHTMQHYAGLFKKTVGINWTTNQILFVCLFVCCSCTVFSCYLGLIVNTPNHSPPQGSKRTVLLCNGCLLWQGMHMILNSTCTQSGLYLFLCRFGHWEPVWRAVTPDANGTYSELLVPHRLEKCPAISFAANCTVLTDSL